MKQKEQYEKAAEKLEDQVGENCAFLLRLTYLREGVKKNRRVLGNSRLFPKKTSIFF